MMTNSLTSLPAHAGVAVLSRLGRSTLWLAKKYAATPLTSTAIVAMVIGMSMTVGNALYGQHGAHPAPLFFGSQDQAMQSAASRTPAPVAPVEIAPAPVRQPVTTQVAGTPAPSTPIVQRAAPTEDDGEVTNAELAEAQSRLQALGLFSGDVDGYYGPETAEAIRAFEMRNGMTPKGDMSRPVIEAIMRTRSSDHASIDAARITARAAETTAPAPQPDITPDTSAVPAQQALAALTAPTAQVAEAPESSTPVAENDSPVVASEASPASTSEQTDTNPTTNGELIERIQTGLASLGFLHGRIDGVAGEGTARAIRNFEVFNNYEVTGRVSPELVDLLVAAGADI